MLRIGFLTTRQHYQHRFAVVSSLSAQATPSIATTSTQHFNNNNNNGRYYDVDSSSSGVFYKNSRSFMSTLQTNREDPEDNSEDENNNKIFNTRGGVGGEKNAKDDDDGKRDVIQLFFERRKRRNELEEKLNKQRNNINNNNNFIRQQQQQQQQHPQDQRSFAGGGGNSNGSSSHPLPQQQRLQRPPLPSSSFQQQQRNGGRQQQQQQQHNQRSHPNNQYNNNNNRQQQLWNNHNNNQQGNNQRYNNNNKNNNWRQQQQQQQWKNNNNNNNNSNTNNGYHQRWAKNRGQQQKQQSQWNVQPQKQKQQQNTANNRLTQLLKELRESNERQQEQKQQNQSHQQQEREEASTLSSILSWRNNNKFKTNNNLSTSTATTTGNDRVVRKWTRPFLREDGQLNTTTAQLSRRQQKKQRQQRQQNQHRDSLEFLMGHLNKPAGDAAADGVITTDSDSDNEERRRQRQQQEEEQRTITLNANAELSLIEASELFRVRVEQIQSKMDQLGATVLDIDTLELLAMEFGREYLEFSSEEELAGSNELLMKQRRIVDAMVDDMENDETQERNQLESSSSPSLSSLPPRPPVVCIMGHVDHGKTTLMDALRRRAVGSSNTENSSKKKTKQKNGGGSKKNKAAADGGDVAGTEAGGITQIISAFEVRMEGQDDRVTFLDTPGHAAFKSMRLSGTHAADVIVLVVAADDGVSAQTAEIIDFYKSIVKGSGDGGITMVVALNKIDKPGIDVEEAQMRIENQLLEQGILCEGMTSSGTSDSEYGPPVQVIPTSGLTGEGLEDLMEGLILQSEVMDLRADEKAFAEGIVMDARMEKGLGAVVDCIVRWGSIEKGDIVVSGTQVAKVRMLKDVNDKMMKKGLPSQPVRIIGFKSLPKAGDPIVCVENEEIAEDMVEKREEAEASESDRPIGPEGASEVQIIGMRSRDSHRLKGVFERANITEDDGIVRIPIIVKADADGSLSAVRESLINLGEDSKHDVVIDPILEGIGEVTNGDIQMAKESEAVIFVFGSKRIEQTTLNLAEQLGVTIECNEIIYTLLDDAKDLFGAYLPKVPTEHVHGRGMVQAIFSVDTDCGEEKVAGMRVTEGNLYKDVAEIDSDKIKAFFRVMRNGSQVSPDGEVVSASSLRHFKELVDSVRRGEECGLALSGFSDFEEGDIIECYSIEMKNGTL